LNTPAVTSFIEAVSAPDAVLARALAIDGSERIVLELRDPNALTQVVGHAKYRTGSTVVLRGHSHLYPNLIPRLFRGAVSPRQRQHESEAISAYSRMLSGGPCACELAGGPPDCRPNWPCQQRSIAMPGLLRGTPKAAVEPLLQHYGLHTRWIDVVDNIWIALWFACHDLQQRDQYGHHVRRNPDTSDNQFAFVTLIDVGDVAQTAVPGVFSSRFTRLVDLRRAVPSVYLRPHAQHALVLASRDWSPALDPDLAHLELATLRISLREALSWLGNGVSLTPYALFPPATKDEGCRRLLDDAPAPPEVLGHILSYGPGW
jgi:hypothetical protein